MEDPENEKGKVLIVDDTISIINMVKTALSNQNYQLFIATTGESAIKSAKIAKPDLILLDILMPEMDGYETCQRLKADDDTKNIPVLFMSALTDVFDKVKAFNLGAVDYVTKPLNVEELLARVNTQVRLSKMQKKLKKTNDWLEKKVEERTKQLKESHEKYKTVADFNYDWEYWQLPDGGFEYISPSCQRITGYSPEEFMNSPKLLKDIIVEEDKHKWDKHIEEEYKNATKEVIFCIKTKNGEKKWIEHACRAVYKNNDEFGGIRVSNREVTERVKADLRLKEMNLKLKKQYDELLAAEEEIKATNDELKGNFELLSKSEKRYRKLADSIPDIVMSVDKKHKVKYINRIFLGLSPDQVIGKSVFKINKDKEQQLQTKKIIDEVFATGKQKVYEMALKDDTREVFFKIKINPVLKNGQVDSLVYIISDTTKEKKLELEIARRKEQFELAMQATHDGLFDWNLTTNEIYYSPGWKKMLGYEEFELENEFSTWEKLTEPDDVKKSWQLLNEHIEGKLDRFEMELKMLHKDGHWVDILSRANAIFDKDGTAVRVVGTHVDITERKAVEKALRDEKEFTDIALDNQIDTFFLFDPKTGRALRWNKAFRDISGYTDAEIACLEAPASYYSEEDLNKVAFFIDDLLKNGFGTIELELISKNGNKIPTEYNVALIHDKDGKKYLILVGRNIAERKQDDKIKATQFRLIEFAANNTSASFLQKYLDEIEELTQSSIGFYHFLEDDQETIFLQAWSTNTIENMCKVEGEGLHYPVSQAGVWVEAVTKRKPIIHNDYEGLGHKKGMPKGHEKVVRELVVPVFRGEKVVAILGVGNKKNNYNEKDIEILQKLADLAWETVVRKQAEEFVIKEKNRVTNILQATNAGTWDWNIQTNEVWNDERWCNIVGFTLDELSSINHEFWLRNMHPDDLEPTMEILNNHLAGNLEYYEAEFRQKHKNGGWVWIQARGKVIEWTEDGKPLRMYGTHLDISKRRRAETELREREELFKSMFYNHASVMLLIDPESGEIIAANNAALKFYGYEKDRLKKLNIYEINTLSKSDIFSEMQAAKKKSRNYFHFKHKLASGEIREVQVYSTPVPFTNKIALYSIVQDITIQRKAEKELKESQERFKAFMNHSPFFAYIKDKNLNYIYSNKHVFRVFKLKERRNIAAKGLFDHEISKMLEKADLEIISGKTDTKELEYQAKIGGKEVWLKDIKFPIQLVDSTVLIGGVAIDITEQKQYEKELEKHQNLLEQLVRERTNELEASNEELEITNEKLSKQKYKLERIINELNSTQAKLIQSEKMASLGVLVAGVAHEINNPVNFINSSLVGLKNNLQYLMDYGDLYQHLNNGAENVIKKIKEKEKEASLKEILEMFRRSIEIIEVGIERTTKIVQGLKAFARSDEKKLEFYDLHVSIENSLLILYNKFKNRIKILREFGEIPKVECFPSQINQVIMNVLSNAIQAINHKGEITIKTSLEKNSRVIIVIADTGSGIPKEQLKQIFDPFFTTKDVGKGTGLGLSISYGIIKDHNGEIVVDSEPGKGTSFKINLPVKQ